LIQVILPDGEQLPVVDAETLHPGRSLGRLFHRSGNHVAVQFEDGVVTFFTPEAQP
jgi:hypothetical protein